MNFFVPFILLAALGFCSSSGSRNPPCSCVPTGPPDLVVPLVLVIPHNFVVPLILLAPLVSVVLLVLVIRHVLVVP